MNSDFAVLSFPTVSPTGTPFDNPYLIDPRTLSSINDLCLWLKSINIIEKSIISTFGTLITYLSYKQRASIMSYKYDEALNDIRSNPIINDLMENLSDEQLIDFFTADELSDYRDVLGKDGSFLYLNDPGRANVVINNITGRYLGHVYSWGGNVPLNPRLEPLWKEYTVASVQGIRSSVVNAMEVKLGEGVRGISYILLASLVETYRQKGLLRIRIIEPLSPMKYVLKKLGLYSIGLSSSIRTDVDIPSAPFNLIIIDELF